MKVNVKISELTAALARLKTVVSRKTTLPILGSVLIEAWPEACDGDGFLKLSVTDLDNWLVLTVDAEVEEGGSVVVPCSRLQAALAKMDGDVAHLASHKAALTGKSNGMRFELLGLAPDEFPPVPKIEEAVERQFAEGVLSAAFARELGAVSEDDTRYVICGVFITQTDGAVRMVATDGRRLATTEMAAHKSDGQTLEVIVPTDACRQMACLDGGGATRLRVTDNQIEASGQGWTLVSKRIEGDYPNWQQVIPPPGTAHRFVVEREKFAEAITFAATICTKGADSVKVELAGKTLRVKASGPDIGSAEAELTAEIAGSEMVAAFKPEYLLDALASFEAATITGEIESELHPLRLFDDKTQCVVMPMRIG